METSSRKLREIWAGVEFESCWSIGGIESMKMDVMPLVAERRMRRGCDCALGHSHVYRLDGQGVIGKE